MNKKVLTDATIDGFENVKYQGFGKLKFIENRLSDLFESYGYCQVEIPTFEAYDFYAGDGILNVDDLFKLISHTGKVLVLKPDTTLPVARIAAINHHDPEEIIKFCYLTNIYSNFPSELEKKETTEAGIEYFGDSSVACDTEIILLSILALKQLGISDIHIDIGHVGFINALLDHLKLGLEDRKTLSRYIENKNLGDIKSFLEKHPGIDPSYQNIILELPKLYGSPEKVIKKMEALSQNPEMERVTRRLSALYDRLKSLGVGAYIHFDIGFTSRMNYYTGMIFKAYLGSYGEAVLNGGRYDSLSDRFGIARPACGFSIDLIKLLDYLTSNKLLEESEEKKKIILYRAEDLPRAHEISASYRREGKTAEIFEVSGSPENFISKLRKNPHYDALEISIIEDGEEKEFK